MGGPKGLVVYELTVLLNILEIGPWIAGGFHLFDSLDEMDAFLGGICRQYLLYPLPSYFEGGCVELYGVVEVIGAGEDVVEGVVEVLAAWRGGY